MSEPARQFDVDSVFYRSMRLSVLIVFEFGMRRSRFPNELLLEIYFPMSATLPPPTFGFGHNSASTFSPRKELSRGFYVVLGKRIKRVGRALKGTFMLFTIFPNIGY